MVEVRRLISSGLGGGDLGHRGPRRGYRVLVSSSGPVRSNGPVSASGSERGHLAALAAVFIWALVPVGTRFFVLRVDPTVFNVVRYAASGASALPFFFHARPWRWPARDQMLLAGCALLAVPGYNIPVAIGAQSVPAAQLGLLIATEPAFIVAFTLLLQRRRMRWRVIAGCAVALAGVALTSGALTAPRILQWAGAAQVLAGAAAWSCYTVLVARLNKSHGALGVTGAVLVVGTVALMVVSAPMLPSKPWPDSAMLLALAAMGVASSTVGFLLWNYAGALLPAERLGSVSLSHTGGLRCGWKPVSARVVDASDPLRRRIDGVRRVDRIARGRAGCGRPGISPRGVAHSIRCDYFSQWGPRPQAANRGAQRRRPRPRARTASTIDRAASPPIRGMRSAAD